MTPALYQHTKISVTLVINAVLLYCEKYNSYVTIQDIHLIQKIYLRAKQIRFTATTCARRGLL